MWQRPKIYKKPLLLILSCVFILSTVLTTTLYFGAAQAASQTSATVYPFCNDHLPQFSSDQQNACDTGEKYTSANQCNTETKDLIQYCQEGYWNEFGTQNYNNATACNKLQNSESLYLACVGGQNNAKANPGTVVTDPNQQSVSMCSSLAQTYGGVLTLSNSSNAISQCNNGYNAATKGDSEQSVCDNNSDCDTGYIAGEANSNNCANTADGQLSMPDCAAYYVGYTAGINGQGDAGCTNSNFTSAETNECEDGYNAATNNNSQDTGATAATCESTVGDLGWIICGVVRGISNGEVDLERNVIQPVLKTKPISFNANDCQGISNTSGCTYKVWTKVRIYGDIVLVLALMGVVFGEAIGGGIIDAYTAKKILPRLLVAAILINLSVYVIAILEDIFNVLGDGLFTIISGPFQQIGQWHITVDGAITGLGTAGLLGVFIAAGATSIWLVKHNHTNVITEGLGMLALAVGVPALIAILGVLITIILRQGILVFLLLVSPIAFALYVLPNTEQYFKKWWNLLFRTLAVYPIITIIFAMANVTAVVIGSFGISPQWMGDIMSIIAICAPLFLVPFAFKLAGGALGSIHQAVTGFSNKAYEKVKGDPRNPDSLQNRVKGRFGRARAGAAADMTHGLSQTGLGRAPGVGGFISRRAARAEAHNAILSAELARNPHMQTVAHDNDAHIAGMSSSHDDAVERLSRFKMNRAVESEYMRLMRENPDEDDTTLRQKAIAAVDTEKNRTKFKEEAVEGAHRWEATGLGYNKAANITAFQAAVADGTSLANQKEQIEMIAAIAGRDKAAQERLVGVTYGGSKAAGRFDQSSGYNDLLAAVNKVADGGSLSDADYDSLVVTGLLNTSNIDVVKMKGMGATAAANSNYRILRKYTKVLNGTANQADIADVTRVLTDSKIDIKDANGNIDTGKLRAGAQQEAEKVLAKLTNIDSAQPYAAENLYETIKRGASKPFEATVATAKAEADIYRAGRNAEVLGQVPGPLQPLVVSHTTRNRNRPGSVDVPLTAETTLPVVTGPTEPVVNITGLPTVSAETPPTPQNMTVFQSIQPTIVPPGRAAPQQPTEIIVPTGGAATAPPSTTMPDVTLPGPQKVSQPTAGVRPAMQTGETYDMFNNRSSIPYLDPTTFGQADQPDQNQEPEHHDGGE